MNCALRLLYHISFWNLLEVFRLHVHKLALDYFFLALVDSKISFIMFKLYGTQLFDLWELKRLELLQDIFERDSEARLVQDVVYTISYEVLEIIDIVSFIGFLEARKIRVVADDLFSFPYGIRAFINCLFFKFF